MCAFPNSGENKKKQPHPFRRLQKLPPWRVVMHDDPAQPTLSAIDALVDLTPLSRAAAAQCLADAHRTGRVKLLKTHLERAELYRYQLLQRNLNITIEPDV